MENWENENLPLPMEKMPEVWKDDMRMNSLFAPFRQRTVNPLDWDSKLKFWKAIIENWCVYNKRSSFYLADLKKAFQRRGCTPLCLETVVDDMLRNGELEVDLKFTEIPQEETWASWTVNLLVKRPLFWSVNKLKESVITTSSPIEDAQYIHLASTKNIGEALISALDECHKNQLLELNELSEFCENKLASQADLNMAVHLLRRQGKAAMTTVKGVTLVKVAGRADIAVVHVTEIDKGFYSLRQNEKTLTKHLEKLETEKQKALTEARRYVAKGMRQAAKSCLRKKHELDKCIDKRASALENVVLLLSRIREAESDSKVLESYQMGVAALKTTFKEAGLTEDNAADTITDVNEILDIQDEIQNTLSQSVGGSSEEDLERELAALLETTDSTPPSPPGKGTQAPQADPDSLDKRLEALRMSSLPSPPKSLPTAKHLPDVPTQEPAFF